MSVNFGSQQLPLTDTFDTQMETSYSNPVSVGMDSLLSANKQLRQIEPSPKSQTPLPVSVESMSSTNRQLKQMELLPNMQNSMPFSVELQQLSSNESFVQVGASPKFQTSAPALGSQQLSFGNRQSFQMEQSPGTHVSPFSNLALQQPLSINKQSVQREPPSKGPKQLSSTNKLSKVEPLTKLLSATSPTSGSPQLSSKNKRKLQAERLPKVQGINVGNQVASSTNRKSMHAEPSPKVPNESFDSVRSKLRESLAAALALVSDQQMKSQGTGKTPSNEETNTQRQLATGNQHGEAISITGSGSSCAASETPSESISSKAENDAFTNKSAGDSTQIWKSDMHDFELKQTLFEGDMSCSNNLVFKDELLQENGLCWASEFDVEGLNSKENGDPKRLKLAIEEATGDVKESTDRTQVLATKIEAELFRLFGGVNKKYKEKGRSLLFNLKDPNNPELRERVFSEEITPGRLCSMTAEELASKQLTEWRIAKAEELAQMVVLTESDVDLRRLVKKTHKGEFQVEVERDDNVPVEVGLGANALPQVLTKPNETKNHSKSVDHEAQNSIRHKETEVHERSTVPKKADSGALEHLNNLNTRPQDMQEFMVDELKDAEFLPPILSLDEFMESLDSEPPFENLQVDAKQDSPVKKEGSDSLDDRLDSTPDMMNAVVPERSEPKTDIASRSIVSESDKASGSLITNQDHPHAAAVDPLDAAEDRADEIDSGNIGTNHGHALGSGAIDAELDKSPQGIASRGENIWEGLVQLNISSLVTVLGFFKSGEKASTEEWPSFLEIKGRVRVDAFEKFLQELPSSRSRAIMVVHFQWKEGSPESGRESLAETSDSYVADERVGFAEPAPGVELYFCPPHPRTIQMLEKHIPKEQVEALASTDSGLVGVVVWRRPHVTSTISPRPSSNHKHSSSSRKHSVSRKQQSPNATEVNKKTSRAPAEPAASNTQPPQEEALDDVPPGFGPPATRDEDDLPEFDFRGNPPPLGSNPSSIGTPHSQGRPSGRPAEQMRELIHKYGQGGELGTPSSGPVQPPLLQPWDDDDDDIPEWQPHQRSQSQLRGSQHQVVQQHQTNPHLMSIPPPKPSATTAHAPQQLVPLGAQLPVPMQTPAAVAQLPRGMQAAWQGGAWWPHAHEPADPGFAPLGLQLPCHYGGPPPVEGQYNGMGGFGNLQNAMDWRSDVPRSRGI